MRFQGGRIIKLEPARLTDMISLILHLNFQYLARWKSKQKQQREAKPHELLRGPALGSRDPQADPAKRRTLGRS